MTNTTYYAPNCLGTRVIAYVHYEDGSSKAITLPRVYDCERTALTACLLLTMNDQQIAQARADELARLAK